jgi:hypothetical protein
MRKRDRGRRDRGRLFKNWFRVPPVNRRLEGIYLAMPSIQTPPPPPPPGGNRELMYSLVSTRKEKDTQQKSENKQG